MASLSGGDCQYRPRYQREELASPKPRSEPLNLRNPSTPITRSAIAIITVFNDEGTETSIRRNAKNAAGRTSIKGSVRCMKVPRGKNLENSVEAARHTKTDRVPRGGVAFLDHLAFRHQPGPIMSRVLPTA